METKKWYLSKTILSNVVVFLLGIYAVAQTSLAPSFGWNLPNVPDWILSILAAIGIYGRVNAKTKIG